ncbi:hypothetical protein PPACK8108_LOCUS8206 [Phakopsora pachyrhizi]|uniref:Uncharacterized protein n=1 Tax=Phakopsora pachyrhizi TaxID=170000 RepID=A0AAV0AUA9_PHAPC|nr:hypothetical protein PPACK8108_LOCUS8206 [Phakopsora pachyrhizi]
MSSLLFLFFFGSAQGVLMTYLSHCASLFPHLFLSLFYFCLFIFNLTLIVFSFTLYKKDSP